MLALLLTLSASSSAGDLQEFRAAEAALDRGDTTAFRQRSRALEGHPLYPYLASRELLGRLDRAGADEVVARLDAWRGTAPGERLRRLWLARLAREQRWAEYAELYVDNGSETRDCLYRRALLETSRADDAFDRLSERWLDHRPLPEVCEALFDAWHAAGGLTPSLVWRRIHLALEQDRPRLAAAQRRRLPAADRPWLNHALALHRRPASVVQGLAGDHAERGAILAHGLVRLAARDPARASSAWRRLRQTLPTALDERVRVAIGEAEARAGGDGAIALLDALRPTEHNIALQLRRLEAALRLSAWEVLPGWVDALPGSQRRAGRWQYWKGRALAESDASEAARQAFRAAARERDLWGFLAAERVGAAPNLSQRPAPADPRRVQRLLGSATVARVRALQRLGRQLDINREWRELTRHMQRPDLLAAAIVAQRLGLDKQAIHTLARTDYWDDLDLRFPIRYRDIVDAAAARDGIASDWLLAVMRQESAFDAQVASHAGAVGLMQLLPSTARAMARQAGEPNPTRMGLIDPGRNIGLGSRYLAAMQARFDGNAVLATAAYNAGPGAVRRWIPRRALAADLWIERIPYDETRAYVRRVLSYRVIYAHRLGLPPLHLGELLRPIGSGDPDGDRTGV